MGKNTVSECVNVMVHLVTIEHEDVKHHVIKTCGGWGGGWEEREKEELQAFLT